MKTTKKLAMGRGARGKKVAAEAVPKPATAGRVPRITKLMALAIKFDQMIRDGVVKDQAELARLGFVTRARVTHIMNLLNLVPAIQESLLDSNPVEVGKDEFTERRLRLLLNSVLWSGQIRDWNQANLSDSGCAGSTASVKAITLPSGRRTLAG
ncbi:hypothetical protein AYO47_03445 [Planctomyces sp. SCGC AG-212-M04]|nr:hypothetical protein AYO47_03445 [Planctomyces sp. SCGC AG-212-M04]